jgi:hypothetical protein
MIRTGIAALALATIGCAGARWHHFSAAPEYVPPRYVDVQVSSRARRRIDPEALKAFMLALQEELSDFEIRTSLARQQRLRPAAVVFLDVERYEEGDRAMRWLCGSFGCGEALLLAVVDAQDEEMAPALEGRVEGWMRGGVFGGSPLDAAEAAGKAIACVVARGSAARCGGLGRSASRSADSSIHDGP